MPSPPRSKLLVEPPIQHFHLLLIQLSYRHIYRGLTQRELPRDGDPPHPPVTFAGYDSTSSIMHYCVHLLSQNSDTLARLCAEHDDILRPDPAAVADILAAHPTTANRLNYTVAVLKEMMRLFAVLLMTPTCGSSTSRCTTPPNTDPNPQPSAPSAG